MLQLISLYHTQITATKIVTAMSSINKQTPQFLGLLLAGGKSSRFDGEDKGLHPFNGKPMAQHVLEQLTPQVEALAISCNRNHKKYQYLFTKSNCKNALAEQPACFSDAHAYPSYGPLSGIYAFISRLNINDRRDADLKVMPNNSRYIMVCCCDMPTLPANLVQRLFHALQNNGHKAAYFTGHFLPCLLDANAAFEQLTNLLQQSEQQNRNFYSVKNLLKRLNATAVSNDLTDKNFLNINSKDDLL
jgi:molybdopterin-guanine dinucleotide biosynthesis protein A